MRSQAGSPAGMLILETGGEILFYRDYSYRKENTTEGSKDGDIDSNDGDDAVDSKEAGNDVDQQPAGDNDDDGGVKKSLNGTMSKDTSDDIVAAGEAV
jgi:hypothetical protein